MSDERSSDLLARGLELDGYGSKAISKINARLIDAAGDIAESDAERIDYLHSVLCQVGLPRSKVAGESFERTSGAASLLIKAGELWNGKEWVQQSIPYGTRPRLALVHISSEAIRTRSRTVDIGNSVRDFLLRLGCDTSGHEYGRFKRQMMALAACEMRLGFGTTTTKANPIERFDAWLSGDQATLWSGSLELSERFYETLKEYATPLDARALMALRHSALAMDVYSWLCHRLHRVKAISGTTVYWSQLMDQFGQEYSDQRNFKKNMRLALRQALAVYTDARVEEVTGGIKLLRSAPAIKKVTLQVKAL